MMNNIDQLILIFQQLSFEIAYLKDGQVYKQDSSSVVLNLEWELSSGYLSTHSARKNLSILQTLRQYSENSSNVVTCKTSKTKWKFKVLNNHEVIYSATVKFTDSNGFLKYFLDKKYRYLTED